MSAATNGQKDGSAVASESHGGGSSATTDKSAPAAGGSSTTSQAAGSNGKDAAAGNDSSKAAQPSPLDGLSPGELRQKLEQTRKELRGYLDKKRKIDQELSTLEASIYAFEGSYLSDALLPTSNNPSGGSQFGNIIKGYDSYLKAPAAGADRKRGRGGEEPRSNDRMFSLSSATYQKAVESRGGIVLEPSIVEHDSASDEETSSSTGRRKRRH